ncbi:ornithine carbamoyltransferase, partial [Rhizobium ruizarguesonis]
AGVAADENIFRSWLEVSVALPLGVGQVYPERWHVRDSALLEGRFRASTDMGELLDADVIVTESWLGDAAADALAGHRVGT